MRGDRIILDHLNGREAAALYRGGQLEDFLIDGDGLRPGAILRGICDRPVKGQGGMFLRLPGGESGFLRRAKGLRPGQPLLVQVTGVGQEGKAVPVTDRLLFKGRHAIVTPGAPGINVTRKLSDEEERARLSAIGHAAMEGLDHGLILRSRAKGADAEEIAEEIADLAALAEAVLGDAEGLEPEALTEGDGPHALAWREWDAPDVVTEAGGFARAETAEALALAFALEHPLNPGHMAVQATRALTAVDVNTGADTSPAAALKANIAAARALPRLLRLRGLGGQVVVDFVSISKAHRRQLEQALRAAFRADPVETSLVGWTAMGLFELNRKRERLPTRPLVGELP